MTLTLTLDITAELERNGEVVILAPRLSADELLEFSERNPLLPVEQTAEGHLVIHYPVDGFTSSRNAELCGDLGNRNNALTTPGIVFGPSAGFTLPNGAVRSPDAAWIPVALWNAFPANLRAPFPHIAPDFVAEVMSPSDRLKKAQEKMDEYIANGVQLGWLIDRANRTVYVHRPNVPMKTLSDPATVSGDPELPGLTVNMARVLQDSI